MTAIDLLRRYSASAWRHRWKAVALIWLVALIGWTGVRMLPDRYVSTARIYADADAVLGMLLRGIAMDNSPAAQVEVLQRTLVSRPNLERLVDRSALSQRIAAGADREKTIDTLARDLRFGSQARNLFTVEYVDSDPIVAHGVVQQVVDLFLELASGSDRRQMGNARAFLLQQLAAYEQQLREAERRRAEFTSRYQDLLALNGSVSRLDAVRARIEAMRGELSDKIGLRALLQQQIDATPEVAAPAGASAADAEQRLMILRQRYTEQHPDVAAARAAVAAARAVGANRTAAGTTRANPVREQLLVRIVDTDSQIASLERQLRDLEAQSNRLEEMARNAPEVQAQFANLDRDYNIIRRNYEELLARRESVNIAEAARTGSDRVTLEVVDPPTMPTIPTSPKRLLLAAGVLLAALGAGGALLFLQVQLDTSFYTLRELRGIGLPVLGAFSAPSRGRLRRADVVLLFLCLLPLPLGLVVTAIGPLNLVARFAV
ncbi:XrtA system polysaccharide chain length determinant [Reyranella soli]|uniref:Chain-length determining protein n=1 Tax=Reyranella soli TaxID=1230389 RepID=A0A512NIX5_9HYPH|nr:XrtA system polysaccharide chain length determinant [Reyranella soli]GEP58899.1 chain-length determining protein [Reyranella soli]